MRLSERILHASLAQKIGEDGLVVDSAHPDRGQELRPAAGECDLLESVPRRS